MAIKWDASLSVGVSFIDSEHQQLITLVNDLQDAMRQGQGRHQLGAILDRLLAYTKSHFSHEETVMKQRGYPQAAAHQGQHQKLLATVNDLRARYHDGSASLTVETSQFLHTWLVGHIKGTDQQFGEWLAARGVANAR